VDTKISCETLSMYTVISLIFIGVNFRELAETAMFVDIGIHGFGTGQITSLAILVYMPDTVHSIFGLKMKTTKIDIHRF